MGAGSMGASGMNPYSSGTGQNDKNNFINSSYKNYNSYDDNKAPKDRTVGNYMNDMAEQGEKIGAEAAEKYSYVKKPNPDKANVDGKRMNTNNT